MWVCSRKVEGVLMDAFVLFLSPVLPNLDRNTDRNNTTCSTLIKQQSSFGGFQGKSNIDKNTCEPSLVFADEA